MSATLLCERCGGRYDNWRITEWVIRVGELQRKPTLCEPCTKDVQAAIVQVLDRVTA